MAQRNEIDDLIELLRELRLVLLGTLDGLDEQDSHRCSTASTLTLAGIVKHLTHAERIWTEIAAQADGRAPDGFLDSGQYDATGDPTDQLLAAYRQTATRSDAAFGAFAEQPEGLSELFPRPRTPWSPPATSYWSRRRALLHLIRETAQHTGHAEIIRESIDGRLTTGR